MALDEVDRLAALMKIAEQHLKSLSTEEKQLQESRALAALVIAVLTPVVGGAWFFGSPPVSLLAYFLGLAVFWALLCTDRRQTRRTADYFVRAMAYRRRIPRRREQRRSVGIDKLVVIPVMSAQGSKKRSGGSSRVGGADALRDLLAAIAFDQGDLVLALQVKPELRPAAEVATEADRRVCGDPAATVQDVGDPPRRYAEIERQPVGAQAGRSKLPLQEASAVCDRRHVADLR